MHVDLHRQTIIIHKQQNHVLSLVLSWEDNTGRVRIYKPWFCYLISREVYKFVRTRVCVFDYNDPFYFKFVGFVDLCVCMGSLGGNQGNDEPPRGNFKILRLIFVSWQKCKIDLLTFTLFYFSFLTFGFVNLVIYLSIFINIGFC